METIQFQYVDKSQNQLIHELSDLASCIVKQHFDPIIGAKQNDYMIQKFQSVPAIYQQIQEGYQYYFAIYQNQKVGFLAFYPKDHKMYLSKFYVDKKWRGHHFAKQMFEFVIKKTKENSYTTLFLNVNKDNQQVIQIYQHLGFQIIREEKNDIGQGFYMDDYVLEYEIK